MTRVRLLEAISAFSPDGEALNRVLFAARINALRRWESPDVLSVAWTGPASHVEVDAYTAVFTDLISGDRKDQTHNFVDVVDWYDSQENPNKAILDLLGGGE